MKLHPIQSAIAESGAVQCGFCTPGIVMELFGLLEEKPDASEQEMTNALNKHLCRCNGYEPIMNGALVAQKLVKERNKASEKLHPDSVGGNMTFDLLITNARTRAAKDNLVEIGIQGQRSPRLVKNWAQRPKPSMLPATW